MRKLHAFLQTPIALRSLAYCLTDALLARIFPGLPDLHGLQPLRLVLEPQEQEAAPLPPPPPPGPPSAGLRAANKLSVLHAKAREVGRSQF